MRHTDSRLYKGSYVGIWANKMLLPKGTSVDDESIALIVDPVGSSIGKVIYHIYTFDAGPKQWNLIRENVPENDIVIEEKTHVVLVREDDEWIQLNTGHGSPEIR